MYRIVVAICLLLSLSLWVSAQEGAAFEPGACPFEVPQGQSVECGTLYVPEVWENPDGPEIALAVAIIPASSGDALPDPIVYLEGGPGGSALVGIDAWYDTDYGVDRDIILIDQRGTGYSEPGLFCYAGEDAEDEIEATELCRDDLVDQGVNLSAYTSAANAADINALRVALGYDQVNLYGVSYGTRLAMTVMRDHPEGIRSVVLDSPFPPAADGFNEDGANFYYSLTTMAADCAADPDCNAAFPDLENAFVDLVNSANDNPIFVDLGDGEQELFGSDVIEAFYGYFYDTAIIPYLPALVYDLSDGSVDALIAFEDSLPMEDDGDDVGEGDDFADEDVFSLDALSDEEFDDLLAEILEFDDIDEMYDYLDSLSDDEYDELLDEIEMILTEEFGGMDDMDGMGEDGDFADPADLEDASGMFNSVTCAEELPFTSAEQQAALLANAPAVIQDHFAAALENSVAVCNIWDVTLSGVVEDAIVQSDIPTLILVGQYDVATPPRWAEVAAEGLSNAYVLEFPGAGHAVIDATPCAVEIGTAFVNNPATEPDTSCLNAIGAPDFYVP